MWIFHITRYVQTTEIPKLCSTSKNINTKINGIVSNQFDVEILNLRTAQRLYDWFGCEKIFFFSHYKILIEISYWRTQKEMKSFTNFNLLIIIIISMQYVKILCELHWIIKSAGCCCVAIAKCIRISYTYYYKNEKELHIIEIKEQ